MRKLGQHPHCADRDFVMAELKALSVCEDVDGCHHGIEIVEWLTHSHENQIRNTGVLG